MGITFTTFTRSIGPISISEENFDASLISKTPTCMPDKTANEKAETYLQGCLKVLKLPQARFMKQLRTRLILFAMQLD